MNISLSWLSEYVALKDLPKNYLDELTERSVEVEHVFDFEKKFHNIVVGQIKKLQKHPSADRLSLVTIDTGKAGGEFDLVCGGSNLSEGIKVAVALPGAKVAHGKEEFEIQTTVIRGVESAGMICAPEELGFMKAGEKEILILGDDAAVGEPLAKALEVSLGVITIDVLPHRSDLMSHSGTAREFGALFDLTFSEPSYDELPEPLGEKKIKISVKDSHLCPRYSALLISNVKVQPSPAWMQYRLLSVGMRPINNIVDLTNYMMLDSGVPFHAFDFEAIAGAAMTVRSSQKGETLMTLDGKEHLLPEGAAVIEDSEKLIDLAGIMGGKVSEVSETTAAILLQAAVFDGGTVRKTSRALSHRTEAVSRYEKGVNAQATMDVLKKAFSLLKTMCPKAELEQVIDENHAEKNKKTIVFDAARVEKLIGAKISSKEIRESLGRIGCEVADGKTGVLEVTAPSWRFDLNIPEDFIEEVVRLHGLNKLPDHFPMIELVSHPKDIEQKIFEAKRVWSAMGYCEAVTYSFIPKSWSECFVADPKKNLAVLNPLSEDQKYMRQSLVPALLSCAASNLRHTAEVFLFEAGRVFQKKGKDECDERSLLSAVSVGGEDSFLKLKGAVEKFVSPYADNEVEFVVDEKHPGVLKIMLSGDEVGVISEVSEEDRKLFDLDSAAAYCELEVEKILSHHHEKQYQPLPKYPSIDLDLAIVVSSEVLWENILQVVRKNGNEFLRGVELFDVYEGSQIASGKRSLAFHLSFRADDRTLTQEEILPAFEKIQEKLVSELGAEVRAGKE